MRLAQRAGAALLFQYRLRQLAENRRHVAAVPGVRFPLLGGVQGGTVGEFVIREVPRGIPQALRREERAGSTMWE